MSRVYLAVLLLLVALVALHLGHDDEQAAADHYADMVCQGLWPDYKGVTPECE